MFYYLYQIKNNINGKIYIGVHKTKNLDDGYMGSGKIIKSAIKKYGIENFTKTILETFESEEIMFNREKELVNDSFLLREDVYNIKLGGYGGFDHINKMVTSEERSVYGKLGGKKLIELYGTFDDVILAMGRKRCKELGVGVYDPYVRALGALAASSPKSIEKRKKTLKENKHQIGEKNSQFGTMWVTNGKDNLKIRKTDILPDGYRKGRII